jgi:hypothetical protein
MFLHTKGAIIPENTQKIKRPRFPAQVLIDSIFKGYKEFG